MKNLLKLTSLLSLKIFHWIETFPKAFRNSKWHVVYFIFGLKFFKVLWFDCYDDDDEHEGKKNQNQNNLLSTVFLSVDCTEGRSNCKRGHNIYGLCDSWQPGQQGLRTWHQSADISSGKTARNQILHGTVPFSILHHSQRHQRIAADPEWRTKAVVWTGV